MTYYLCKWAEGDRILYKRGDSYQLLADQRRGKWRWCSRSSDVDAGGGWCSEISQEEAAMIMFQCVGPA